MTRLFIITLLLISTAAYAVKVKQTVKAVIFNGEFVVTIDAKKSAVYVVSTATDLNGPWTVYTNIVPRKSGVVTLRFPHDEAIGLVKVREE